jgi:hypothetical protein
MIAFNNTATKTREERKPSRGSLGRIKLYKQILNGTPFSSYIKSHTRKNISHKFVNHKPAKETTRKRKKTNLDFYCKALNSFFRFHLKSASL